MEMWRSCSSDIAWRLASVPSGCSHSAATSAATRGRPGGGSPASTWPLRWRRRVPTAERVSLLRLRDALALLSTSPTTNKARRRFTLAPSLAAASADPRARRTCTPTDRFPCTRLDLHPELPASPRDVHLDFLAFSGCVPTQHLPRPAPPSLILAQPPSAIPRLSVQASLQCAGIGGGTLDILQRATTRHRSVCGV